MDNCLLAVPSIIVVIRMRLLSRLSWSSVGWHRSAVAKDFRQHYADILKDSPSQVVYNDKELINATNAYLDHPTLDQDNRLKSLMRMTTIIDGTASKQLVKFIKKHANQQ